MINAIKKEIKRLSKKAFHKELVQKKGMMKISLSI
jgi:hypothetical protein